MIRGTTPTFRFILPEIFKNIKIQKLYVSIAQSRKVQLEKNIVDSEIQNNIILIQLSQEETLKFRSDIPIEIQVSIKDDKNKVYRSNIIKTDVKRILKEGII